VHPASRRPSSSESQLKQVLVSDSSIYHLILRTTSAQYNAVPSSLQQKWPQTAASVQYSHLNMSQGTSTTPPIQHSETPRTQPSFHECFQHIGYYRRQSNPHRKYQPPCVLCHWRSCNRRSWILFPRGSPAVGPAKDCLPLQKTHRHQSAGSI
jgi:hypothetical protein